MAEPICLTQFGGNGVHIPANLKDLCKYLPKWDELKTMRNPTYHGAHNMYLPHTYFYDASGTPYMPALKKGSVHNEDGGYSIIFKAQRAIYEPNSIGIGPVSLRCKQSFEESCIKEIYLKIEDPTNEAEYVDEIKAIVYEAFLHALVDTVLERHGLRGFVPELHEVAVIGVSGEQITKPQDIECVWMVMEFMDGFTLEKYLEYKFAHGSKESNSRLLKDILIQLAYMLNTLEKHLLFNHRDLKINNLYVRVHGAAADWKRTLHIFDLGVLEFQTDLVMIDFGFSCVACGTGFKNPRLTMIGAGSYFSPDDDCLKPGRDLAQFLYSLHCYFSLQNHITKPLFDFLHAAVRAEKRGTFGTAHIDLYKGVDDGGKPIAGAGLPASITYNDGIYTFLRDCAVEVPGCASERFLRALHALPL
jgi:hypothetical protein